MATPLGHSVLGLIIVRGVGKNTGCHITNWYVFALVAANAPDLDFLPGLLLGDINLYHQGISHSFAAALLFTLFSMLLAPYFRASTRLVAMVGGLAYLSHLLLDMFVNDKRPPFGLPLAWPISDQHWQLLPILPGVRHGIPGDSIGVFFENIFSFHNIMTLLLEVVIILPLLVAVWFFSRSRWQGELNS